MLGTQGWQKFVDETQESQESTESENPLNAIDRLVEHFRFPLERAVAQVSEIHGEFEAGSYMLHSSFPYPPQNISQSGGGCFMHQILPSGRMY